MKTFLIVCVFCCFLLHWAQSVAVAHQGPDTSSMDCKICQHVMKIIWYETLKQNNNLKAIHHKIVTFFKRAPFHIKENDYSFSQVDIFVKMLKEVKDPQNVCEIINKCPEPKRPETWECDTCTDIVGIIKAELELSNATIQTIIDAIREICSDVPIKPVKEECLVILDAIDDIITWLEEEMDPKDICIRLHFCRNNTFSQKLNENKIRTCRAVAYGVKILNEKGWSEKRMIKKIEHICSHLAVNKLQCYHIQTKFKAILTSISLGEEPDNVCGNKLNNLIIRRNSSILCDLCKMVLETVDTVLNDVENGLENVQKALDGLCNDLEDVEKQCKYVVDLVMEDLERNVNYIKENLDPTKTCEAFKLCSKSVYN